MKNNVLGGDLLEEKEGLGYEEKAEEVPEYNNRNGDCTIDGRGITKKGTAYANNNSAMVLGRDRGRDGHVLSGYGGLMGDRAGAIDLVVGRMSPRPKSNARAGKYENDPIFTYTNGRKEDIKGDDGKVITYFNDAARIYISQRTDVDYNFRIIEGRTNPSPDKEQSPASAITLQADDIRMVSRRGVKIVTLGSRGYGDIGVFNSLGSRLTKTYGIDLIAGNGYDANGAKIEQEPLVKGNQLAQCLNELSKRIDEIQDNAFNFMKNQIKFNNLMMNHTHGETFAGGITLWSPAAQGASIFANMKALKNCFSIMHSGMNLMNWRKDWLGLEINNSSFMGTDPNAGVVAKFNSKYNSTN